MTYVRRCNRTEHAGDSDDRSERWWIGMVFQPFWTRSCLSGDADHLTGDHRLYVPRQVRSGTGRMGLCWDNGGDSPDSAEFEKASMVLGSNFSCYHSPDSIRNVRSLDEQIFLHDNTSPVRDNRLRRHQLVHRPSREDCE